MPRAGKHLALTILSYLFYGWANPVFMLLMLVSTLIDYVTGLVIAYNGFKGWGRPIEIMEKGGPRSCTQKIALTSAIDITLAPCQAAAFTWTHAQ